MSKLLFILLLLGSFFVSAYANAETVVYVPDEEGRGNWRCVLRELPVTEQCCIFEIDAPEAAVSSTVR